MDVVSQRRLCRHVAAIGDVSCSPQSSDSQTNPRLLALCHGYDPLQHLQVATPCMGLEHATGSTVLLTKAQLTGRQNLQQRCAGLVRRVTAYLPAGAGTCRPCQDFCCRLPHDLRQVAAQSASGVAVTCNGWLGESPDTAKQPPDTAKQQKYRAFRPGDTTSSDLLAATAGLHLPSDPTVGEPCPSETKFGAVGVARGSSKKLPAGTHAHKSKLLICTQAHMLSRHLPV